MSGDVRTNVILGTKVAEVRMNILRACLLAGGAGIPLTVACLWLAGVLGHPSNYIPLTDLLIALAIFVPVGIVHELLHGAAAIVHGRLRWADIHIGVYGGGFALTCETRVPIRVRTARIVGIAPLVVMGPLAVVALIVFPSNVTALLAGFTFIGATMDLLMLNKLRPFDGNLLFVDHPKEPAFDIYAPSGSQDLVAATDLGDETSLKRPKEQA
jgi:hypothetical protein